MKRRATVLLLLFLAVTLTGCKMAPGDDQPYPYGAQTPRTTPVFKAPVAVPANVDPNLSIPILMYHEIAPHTPKMGPLKLSLLVMPNRFAEQMQYLKDRGFTTITLDDWMAARNGRAVLPRNPVIITFDDGRIGVYENAFPVLRRNGQKAIMFLISAEVGRVVKRYVSWQMVSEMQSAGVMTFGSHMVHHAVLPLLSTQRAFMELMYSRKLIQQHTGTHCDYFCYPHGKYDARTVNLVQLAGYRAATTEIPGRSRVTDHPFELRRIRVDGLDSMAVFSTNLGPGG
jgi:peptidoglycan/xylan/chitin deacetylase (PgdA/CDA1 family)